MLCYDVGNRYSFDSYETLTISISYFNFNFNFIHIVCVFSHFLFFPSPHSLQDWLDRVNVDAILYICGLKSDLPKEKRKVQKEEGQVRKRVRCFSSIIGHLCKGES